MSSSLLLSTISSPFIAPSKLRNHNKSLLPIVNVARSFKSPRCAVDSPYGAKEKSPSLDDGGDGFPPRDDGDGGGGGGGGGNWSGGFFFFGFLAFLGLLKDKEGEEDYRGSRRR